MTPPHAVSVLHFDSKILINLLSDCCQSFYSKPFPSFAVVPKRDHVFHITFPLQWKQSDIVNHFRKFGSVFIRWINQTSAFVALNNRENSSILLDSIAAVKGVKIVPFKQYSELKQLEEVRSFTLTEFWHCLHSFCSFPE